LGTWGANHTAFGSTNEHYETDPVTYPAAGVDAVGNNAKGDSYNAMLALLASLGITSNLSNYYSYTSNGWYYINYSAINAFLNGNNNTTTNTGN
jgi:hypothetical protein